MKRAVLVIALAACGSKHPSRDCGAYAAKFAATIDADPSRRDTMLEIAKGDCEKGHVDDKLFACVMKAATSDDIMVCQGLQPPPH